MKRDFLLPKDVTRRISAFIISVLISNAVMLLLMVVLALMQKKWSFSDGTLRMTAMIMITISSGACAYLFNRLSKLKGYLCGLITFAFYGIVKLIMSLASGGVGGGNIMIYFSMAAAALLGGILSANRKEGVSKIYK